MRRIITFYCCLLLPWISYAQTNQTGTGLDCNNAFYTTDNLFCSDNAHYNISNIAQNGITWFKFKAILPVVNGNHKRRWAGGKPYKSYCYNLFGLRQYPNLLHYKQHKQYPYYTCRGIISGCLLLYCSYRL